VSLYETILYQEVAFQLRFSNILPKRLGDKRKVLFLFGLFVKHSPKTKTTVFALLKLFAEVCI